MDSNHSTPAVSPNKKFNLIAYYKMPVIASVKFPKDFWTHSFPTQNRNEIKQALTLAFLLYFVAQIVRSVYSSSVGMAVVSAIAASLVYFGSLILWALYVYFFSRIIFRKNATYENVLALTFYIQLVTLPFSIIGILLPAGTMLLGLIGGCFGFYMIWHGLRHYIKMSAAQVIVLHVTPIVLLMIGLIWGGSAFLKKLQESSSLRGSGLFGSFDVDTSGNPGKQE